MRKILVVFASQSVAAQIKKHLFFEYEITVKIIPTPEKLAVSGCGFSIEANYADIKEIKEMIENAKVSSKGIFDAETGEKI